MRWTPALARTNASGVGHGVRRPVEARSSYSLIVSHFHPDHVGLANWLVERCDIGVTMPRPEYLHSLVLQHAPADFGKEVFRPFYTQHGLAPDATEIVLSRGHEYLHRTTGVPASYHRIKHNDTLRHGRAGVPRADRRRAFAGAGDAVSA